MAQNNSSPRRVSPIWAYFTQLDEDASKVSCNECLATVSRGSSSVSQRGFNTSNLLYHLRTKHMGLYQNYIGKKTIDNPSKTTKAKNAGSMDKYVNKGQRNFTERETWKLNK